MGSLRMRRGGGLANTCGTWCPSLILCCVVCCHLLPSPSQGSPIQAGYTLPFGLSNVPNPSNESFIAGLAIATSAHNVTVLTMNSASDINGLYCYLNIGIYKGASNFSGSVVDWTAPCPLRPLASANCSFSFTLDGDMQLWNGVPGKPNVLVWHSNTKGLGATTLVILDSEPQTGSNSNIILQNSKNETVWGNIINATEPFDCTFPPSSRAAKQLSISYAILIFVLGSLLASWVF